MVAGFSCGRDFFQSRGQAVAKLRPEPENERKPTNMTPPNDAGTLDVLAAEAVLAAIASGLHRRRTHFGAAELLTATAAALRHFPTPDRIPASAVEAWRRSQCGSATAVSDTTELLAAVLYEWRRWQQLRATGMPAPEAFSTWLTHRCWSRAFIRHDAWYWRELRAIFPQPDGLIRAHPFKTLWVTP